MLGAKTVGPTVTTISEGDEKIITGTDLAQKMEEVYLVRVDTRIKI